jgi:hypothetical protein
MRETNDELADLDPLSPITPPERPSDGDALGPYDPVTGDDDA